MTYKVSTPSPRRGLGRGLFLLLVLLLASCGDSQHEYTVNVAYFVFDNSKHQDATLAASMNVNSPGIFCRVTQSMQAGATLFNFENNAGVTSSVAANALDQQRRVILGHNNGLIVGYGNLSTPAVFYVYDRECPNCFDPTAIPMKSKPLSMSNNGLATCGVCHRQYDMNNGGNIVNGDGGNKLTRYHGTCTGPFGVLAVQ